MEDRKGAKTGDRSVSKHWSDVWECEDNGSTVAGREEAWSRFVISHGCFTVFQSENSRRTGGQVR